ncbi:odorant receptor 13a-like isoform X1 [Apis cerana]|uniref:odorant receptor 13a-like isoform X1 n=1 Tax=Apis cerana TaxID=7461 RepID=UPI002B2303BC|nr:odorant receptor 13a-like isoform X1 [Apis cerana]
MNGRNVRNLSITVTAFYMKIAGFWVASNYAEKRWRNIAMFVTIFFVFMAITIEGRDLYFVWGDFEDSIFAGCNVITIVLVLFKIFILYINNEELLNVVNYAKTNFWRETNYDAHEKKIIDDYRRLCSFLVCSFTFFAQGTVVCFLITPVFVNNGKNESDRIHPFNMWFDRSLSLSPYYEIIYTIQILTAYEVGICYHCFDNLLFVINLYTAGQFRILRYRFENICGKNDGDNYHKFSKSSYCIDEYKSFKNCVQQHQTLIEYCKKLEDVFSIIVLAQVLLFSLLICLDGYLVLMEDTSSAKRIIFTFHLMGCMCQLLMFTYSCDCLMHDSMSMANAVYSSLWSYLPMDKYGKLLRKDLMFVIMRSRSPCCLTACGFFPVSLETYTGILSTAVSYFTLLRNQSTDTS